MTHLDDAIQQLTERQVLSSEQAELLRDAAGRDSGQLPVRPGPQRPRVEGAEAGRAGAVLEVLGYIGGALLLGAVIFLTASYWDDLDRTGRNLVAVAALVISAGGGLALVLGHFREDVGKVLLALSCYAAGFAYLTLFSDDTLSSDGAFFSEHALSISSGVVVAASVVGIVLLRAGALLVSGWSGGMLLVTAVITDQFEGSDSGEVYLAVGFLVVGAVLAVVGFVLSRRLAWSLAGLSSWVSAATWLAAPVQGEWVALIVATLVSGLLLFAFVRTRAYSLAVIGCLVLLTLWPTCLYEIFESALGVATGLIAAGGVLIATVVVMSRLRRVHAGSTMSPS
jgi:hypothetical protein